MLPCWQPCMNSSLWVWQPGPSGCWGGWSACAVQAQLLQPPMHLPVLSWLVSLGSRGSQAVPAQAKSRGLCAEFAGRHLNIELILFQAAMLLGHRQQNLPPQCLSGLWGVHTLKLYNPHLAAL